MPLWAYGPEDRPRLKLDAAALHAWVDDQSVPVESVQRPGDPLILLLVMDAVGDLNRIDAARQALGAHIESMGKEWHVALLQAQDGLQVVEDPSRNRRLLIEKLNALSVSGFPGLLDAVDQAADIAHAMLQRADVRVAVLFVTDGAIGDYRGDYTASVVNPSDRGDLSRRFRDRLIQEKVATVTKALQSRTSPLFFVHLEERSDTLNVAYQNGIRQFASTTAGEAYFVRGVADVATSIESALGMIERHYALTIQAPADQEGTAAIRIEADPSLQLTYRQGLDLVQPQSGSR